MKAVGLSEALTTTYKTLLFIIYLSIYFTYFKIMYFLIYLFMESE
jgi:hypothetical protein